MWCEKCQAEVAAEVSRGGRIQCATCSSDIAPSRSLRATSRTREARDLLERWSRQPPADPFGPLLSDQESELQTAETTNSIVADAKPSEPLLRVDSAHAEAQRSPQPKLAAPQTVQAADSPVANPEPWAQPAASAPQQSTRPSPSAAPPNPTVAQPPQAPFSPALEPPRVHPPHKPASQAPPHFDVQSFVGQGQSNSNFVALAGQFLAYGGVALLTVGTVLVLWGYFGGPEGYTPTGWLISTAGQMLLFLGIVTLVSGGIEHTAEQMRSEIRLLGDKLIRIERASHDHALKGPSIPAEQFSDSAGAGSPPRSGRSIVGAGESNAEFHQTASGNSY